MGGTRGTAPLLRAVHRPVSLARSGEVLGLARGCCLRELTRQHRAWEGSGRRQGHKGGSTYHIAVTVGNIVKLTAIHDSDQDRKIAPNPPFCM